MEKDELTGLMNRVTFQHDLGRYIQAGGRGALLEVDFDHAKSVNEVLGYPFLDDCIIRLARLVERVAGGCRVARYGGDELLVFVADAVAAAALAEQIRAAVEQDARFVLVRNLMANSPWQPVLTVSIGITVLKAGRNLGHVLDAVNEALWRAKSRGRNRLAQA
jgi:diguanylate cyclase (GGDEF)-like protein